MMEIKAGDRVKVIQYGNRIYWGIVHRVPQRPGEAWKILDDHGHMHYVLKYLYMVKDDPAQIV